MAFHSHANQKKRKDEHSHFKESWTYNYSIIENNQKLLCLIRNALTSHPLQFYESRHENQKLTKVSYVVSEMIAKMIRPHTDGKFVPSLHGIVFPEEKATVSKLCLSARTRTRRIGDIANHITSTLRERAANFKYFYVAVDESTDMADTARLCCIHSWVDELRVRGSINFVLEEV